jgi:hypothetical protein
MVPTNSEESPCFVAERWCISTPLLKAGQFSKLNFENYCFLPASPSSLFPA